MPMGYGLRTRLASFWRSRTPPGGSIAAAEFFNEPTFAAMAGAPKGYDAAAYGRDFKVFLAFAKKAAPDMAILGPGSLGETGALAGAAGLKTQDLLAAAGRGVDAFSYHFYGAVSKRCAGMAGVPQITPEAALSEEWLSRTDRDQAFYAALRDRFEPGKPLWLTETAEAACGGDAWAASFLDSFRYLDQLGRLAKRGVRVVAHNTLAASDYGLIDETTFLPRPNYWSALLWHTLMGSTVLDAGTSPVPAVHLYAHCLRDQRGGVALLAINTDRDAAHDLVTPIAAGRYTLTAKDLMETSVELNGAVLKLGVHDALPELKEQAGTRGPGDAGAGEHYVPRFPERGQCELPVSYTKKKLVGRRKRLPHLLGGNLEGTDETAAMETVAPGFIQAVALVGVLQRVGGHGMLQLGERRIVDVFVAAGVVGFGHAAGGDLGERSGGEAGGAAVNVAVLHDEFDGRRLHFDDVGEQVRRLRFGEGDERAALFGSGAAIHDEHGDGGVDRGDGYRPACAGCGPRPPRRDRRG